MKTIQFVLRAGALLLVCIFSLIYACQQRTVPPVTGITEIAEPVTEPGWMDFRPDAKVNPKTLFRDYAAAFHLPAGNEMIIQSDETDSLGITLYRYRQFYRKIEVENAVFLVRASGDRAISANGSLAFDFQPEVTTEAIPEEQAWESARDYLPAPQYYQPGKLMNSLTQGEETDPDYRPAGEKMYVEDPRETGGERLLAWVFKMYVWPLENSKQVYVSAQDGSIFKAIPLMPSCFTGSGPVTFRGTQPINTRQAGNRFYLTDDCNGTELYAGLLDTLGKSVKISDDDNNWAGNNPSVVTSFWGLSAAYDYFRLIHNRLSYDGKNSKISIFNNPRMRNGGHNAIGGGGFIQIGLSGNSNDTDDYNCLDVIGHEFMHNVIETSSRLTYDTSQEASALNESFCDIFGQMTEQWLEGESNKEWVIADDKGCAAPYLCRDLMNPKTYNQPDTYNGTFWQTTGISPHNNGCVQNRWFALLTDGGAGTNNELGTTYSVNGIGMVKARQIAWRTVTFYLTPTSGYRDARNGSIRAAQDLFGENAPEVGEVLKAWCAVGLCPYTVPRHADIFDRSGGNPNPASPDNNNSVAGATPLGRGIQGIGTGGYPWSVTAKPRLTVNDLSIFPAGDADFFNIRFPEVETLGGRCFQPGFSFHFGTAVNARIYLNGVLHKSWVNTTSFNLSFAESQSDDVVLEVRSAFPGQILSYHLKLAFYQHFDSMCYQTSPPERWERIRSCPMCDVRILGGFDKFVLEPFYRMEDLISVKDNYFYWYGDGGFEIPVRMLEGNALRAELVDEFGRLLAVAEKTNAGNGLLLRAPELLEGIYSIRFSGYGNGTQVEVFTPQR